MHQLMFDHVTLSIRGRGRRENEDFFIADDENHLYILCDGIGGFIHGAHCSQLASCLLRECLENLPCRRVFSSEFETNLFFIKKSLEEINERIYSPYLLRGTTLTFIHILPPVVFFGSIGDSRIYQWDPEFLSLKQMTRDDITVTEGCLNEIPQIKKMLTRAVGPYPTLSFEVDFCFLKAPCSYLLCSDGFTRDFSDCEIKSFFTQYNTPSEFVEMIRRKSQEKDRKDDTTIILLQVTNMEKWRN